MRIDINNIEVKRFSDRLRQMHRSNLPIVVRQTLNDMAFDVKQHTLLKSADKAFILRNPGFFKKHSGVKKAVGWDVNSMESIVGIEPKGIKAAEQLTKQEFGGTISNRSAIYMKSARVSGSNAKKVRRQNYLGTKGIVRGRPSAGRTRKSNFVAAAYMAQKEGKFLLWEGSKNETIFDIKSVGFTGKGRHRSAKINAVAIADYEKNRSVNLQARPFLKPASLLSYQKANTFFAQNAKKRFEK